MMLGRLKLLVDVFPWVIVHVGIGVSIGIPFCITVRCGVRVWISLRI
jgi:hypothetical protein